MIHYIDALEQDSPVPPPEQKREIPKEIRTYALPKIQDEKNVNWLGWAGAAVATLGLYMIMYPGKKKQRAEYARAHAAVGRLRR